MIGSVAGELERIAADYVVVDVRGVGFEIWCHAGTLAAAPPVGTEVRFYTDLQFRSDSLRLYGFADERERAWFRLLMGVPGVGAKGAMAILGVTGAVGLAEAVALENPSAIRRAAGVGARLADRVVRELKGKAPEFMLAQPDAAAPDGKAEVYGLAVSALRNLGFSQEEAGEAVRETMTDLEDGNLEEIIRSSLRRVRRPGG